MFSYLAFLNLENDFLSNLFKQSFNEEDLENDPLNYRFAEIDIFYTLFSLPCVF